MYKEKRLFAKHKKKRPKTMSKFINPFTDYGFKLIFGREVSKDLLIEFLNDLLEGERVITDLQFLNNEQLPLYPEGRGIIYDVYCTTDTGEKIIVEMQNRMQSNFKERSIYYLSRAIINQGRVGNEWKFEIKAVYGVFLMNFIIDKNIKLRTDVILSDRETGELFSDKFREIFIALPLFNKNEEECETNFERWIYILNNMETLKRLPFKARKAVFEKLEEIADVASMSPKERELYDNSVKVYRDYLVRRVSTHFLTRNIQKQINQSGEEKADNAHQYQDRLVDQIDLLGDTDGYDADQSRDKSTQQDRDKHIRRLGSPHLRTVYHDTDRDNDEPGGVDY